MATLLHQHLWSVLPELRFQPTLKRVRVSLGSEPVADTTRAVLVFEPMRVVPHYAVPEDDLLVEARLAEAGAAPDYEPVGFGSDRRRCSTRASRSPCTPPRESRSPSTRADRSGAGFRLTDPDLAGYVSLDFDDFDWREEDEPIVSHPRDPFHRIDVRAQLAAGADRARRRCVLAESDRPHLLFEATLPAAPLLPAARGRGRRAEPRHPGDVLRLQGPGHPLRRHRRRARRLPDLAWSYEEPLDDAEPVQGLVCFYQERLDLFLDGRGSSGCGRPGQLSSTGLEP